MDHGVTEARYGTNLNLSITATIDGQSWSVPIDPANRQYAAILEWVADGNTIEAASQEDRMGKGQKHYLKNGTEFTGKTHKMSNGSMHTGLKHTKGSKVVVHLKELSKTAQKKAGA